MKTKRILLSLLLLLGAMGSRAQEWRGFLEMFAGITPSQTSLDFKNERFSNVWNPLSFGLNFTMGVKVHPMVFAGIGIGGYTSYLGYKTDYSDHCFPSLYFPVFANVRWIPDISNKINPFIDLKIGYQMGLNLDENRMWGNYDDAYRYYAGYKNGVFLQPGVGVRFGRDSAFNLGLAYNVSMGQKFTAVDITNPDLPVTETITRHFGSILITLGADF